MAAEGCYESSRSENLDFSLDNFEKTIKDRLGWSKKKWNNSSEENSRVHKLSNSMQYWGKKLKPALDSTSSIVTLFNFDKDVKVSLLEIIDGLRKLDRKVVLEGFSDFRNPRYLCLHFKDEETKAFVEQKFRVLNGNYVVYLAWALEPQTVKVKVHWLSMNMNVNAIKKHLESYFEFKEQKNVNLALMNGEVLRSGKISFRVKMKEGVGVDDVPHLTNIAGLEALITIRGRLPLCLTCNIIGHIAKVCPTPFCSECKMLKAKGHICNKSGIRSYANVAGSATQSSAQFDEWDSNNEDTIIGENVNSTGDKEGKKNIAPENTNDLVVYIKKTKDCEFSERPQRIESVVFPSPSKIVELSSKGADTLDTASSQGKHLEDQEAIDDSDVDLSHIEGYKNMERYIQELNSFRLEALDRGGGGGNTLPSPPFLDNKQVTVDMETDARKMKRKLVDKISDSEAGAFSDESKGEGWIKCYGNRRRGGRVKKTLSAFDDKMDKREFIFSD